MWLMMEQVEEQRKQDAADGVEIASILEGFVRRKVIKQSVMTTVYGVTLYGAKLQIRKQLKGLDDFPQEHAELAAAYLAKATLASIAKIFNSSREIQDWFGHISSHIARELNCRVSWRTPLGLPVIQPYVQDYQPSSALARRSSSFKLLADSLSGLPPPNPHRQKNAFPPNFIHSLDSCHMMLTALHCFRRGITFASVHDCFWTHAAFVDTLNEICRQEFVELHSQPILEDLSLYLRERFAYTERELRDLESEERRANAVAFNDLLTRIPSKGSFDLNEVLSSTYFFS